MDVRRATVADAEAITTLHIASWRAHYRGILPDEQIDGLDHAERLAKRTEQLSDPAPGIEHWVVEDEGPDGAAVVRGWGCIGPVRDDDLGADHYELYALYVRPEDVGGGFGRRLNARLVERAAELGAGTLVLWVLTENALARRFYERAGYALDEGAGERVHAANGATVVRMWRAL